MNLYTNIVIIITLAVFISYINYRFIKMQPTIAIMATSLFLSVVLVLLDRLLGFHVVHQDVVLFVNRLHFHDILMNCMLGLLLFAGALTIDIPHLKQQKWEIIILATVGVIFSTIVIGFSIHYLLSWFNLQLPVADCFLFGALISPTDPVAVLAILKNCKVSKKLEMLMSAESLFNDGVGVVLFIALYYVTFNNQSMTLGSVVTVFAQEALGGLGFGLVLGILAYLLMKPVDDQKIEILITIALVTGGYTLAQSIGVSGPLAMVTAGIFIASHKREIFRSEKTREHLESFWELIDELLNAILFLLIGSEILLVHFSFWLLVAAICTIPLVLFVRYITVLLSMGFFKATRAYPTYTLRILTWGGLRGGLAVALALAMPNGNTQDILLPLTYVVVLFSILVQGTTVRALVKRSKRRPVS